MIRTTLLAIVGAVALAEGVVIASVAQAQSQRVQAERSQWLCLKGADRIAMRGEAWDNCQRVVWRREEW